MINKMIIYLKIIFNHFLKKPNNNYYMIKNFKN